MKKYFLILVSTIFVMCNQVDDLSDMSNSGNEVSKTISGFAQKGPFSRGSQVTIFGLDEKMQPNGKSWPANIDDATGSFSVAVKGITQYMEIRVDGYYYNEITGKPSDGQITLEAITDLNKEKVNVNILTHLVRPRIKKLIQGGMSFSEARRNAETELVSALGYSEQSVLFDQLDITKSREGDALLLALACKLQKGRQAGEMLTLINEISLEFAEEGKLSENTLAKLETKFSGNEVMGVYENMNKFYLQNNMQDAVIPDFYQYLPLNDIMFPAFILSHKGTETDFEVYLNMDFTVESDVDWIEVSKEHINGPCYKVYVKVHENTTTNNLTGKIMIKDVQGNILGETSISIPGKYAVLRFRPLPDPNKISEEYRRYWQTFGNEMISINGDDYPILSSCAKVDLSESYVAIYPAGKSQKLNENTLSINIPSVCKGQFDSAGMIGALSDIDTNADILPSYDLYLDFIDGIIIFDFSNYPDWTDAELVSNCASNICGDYVISSQTGEFIGIENGKSSIRINRSSDDLDVYVHAIPCTLKEGITLTINCSDGNSYPITTSKEIVISSGMRLKSGVVPRPTYPVESISLNVTKLEMNTNGQITLVATISPSNATNKKVTWSSSDPDVASVVDGKVHAHKAGKATIIVTTEDGEKTATCEILVNLHKTVDGIPS